MKTTKSKKQIFRSKLPIKKYAEGGEIDPLTGLPKTSKSFTMSAPQSQFIVKRKAVPISKPIPRATQSYTDPNALVDPSKPFDALNNPWEDKPGKLATPDYQMTNPKTGLTSSVSPDFYNSYKDITSAKPQSGIDADWTKMKGTGINDLGLNRKMFSASPTTTFALGGETGKGIHNALDKTGDFFGNMGRATADIALSTVGMNNVIQNDDYHGAGADFNRQVGNTVGGITKSLAPMAANMIAPGSGKFISIGQNALGNFNPQDNTQDQMNQYCYGGNVKMAEGGETKATINVEGKELEVKNGKLIRDFKGKPAHPEEGIDQDGNVKSTIGNIIIPTKMRDKYLNGDKITRASIEHNLVQDQKMREQDEAELSDKIYSNGGSVYIRPRDKKAFIPAAKRAGMDVEEYMNQLTEKKFGDGGMIGGNMPENSNADDEENSLPVYMYGKGGWIKGAVNPAHKGYCSPMTKSTCTPHRKAFAMTMKKHHGFHKMAQGGTIKPINQDPQQVSTDMFNNVFDNVDTMPQEQTINSPVGQLTGNPENITPNTRQPFNWQDSFNSLATVAPTAYNIGRGLLDKPTQYNSKDYTDQSMIPYRDINFDPIKNSIYQERNTAKANAASASGGGAGNYLSNAVQIGANTQHALADAEMKAQEYNSGNRFNVDVNNRGQRNLNNQTKLSIAQINAMNKAKKSEFLGKGLEGASVIAQNNKLMKNQKAASEMAMGSFSDMFDDIVFDKTTGKWKAR